MEKWLMFKNYMHNELGITKEDIRDWIREAVKQQAEALVAQEHKTFNPADVVRNMLIEKRFFGDRELINQVKEQVAEQLAERFTLTLKSHENQNEIKDKRKNANEVNLT